MPPRQRPARYGQRPTPQPNLGPRTFLGIGRPTHVSLNHFIADSSDAISVPMIVVWLRRGRGGVGAGVGRRVARPSAACARAREGKRTFV